MNNKVNKVKEKRFVGRLLSAFEFGSIPALFVLSLILVLLFWLPTKPFSKVEQGRVIFKDSYVAEPAHTEYLLVGEGMMVPSDIPDKVCYSLNVETSNGKRIFCVERDDYNSVSVGDDIRFRESLSYGSVREIVVVD